MIDAELLKKAEEFHGHVCPFLVLGVRASEIALKRLKVSKLGYRETIGERVVAIVEANNCFADGVQIATGCTLGNNSLIYLDLGKNAVTLLKRGESVGVRVYVDAERVNKYIPQEAQELFRRVVMERRCTGEDVERLSELWREAGLKMASIPDDVFEVMEVEVVEELERAPIFDSARCNVCGELAMSTRVVYVDGKPCCLACANASVNAVLGRGIVTGFKLPYRTRGGVIA